MNFDEIAAEYGTPTYVYDGDHLDQHLRELRAALHPALEVFFSLKSNPNRGVYDVLRALEVPLLVTHGRADSVQHTATRTTVLTRSRQRVAFAAAPTRSC